MELKDSSCIVKSASTLQNKTVKSNSATARSRTYCPASAIKELEVLFEESCSLNPDNAKTLKHVQGRNNTKESSKQQTICADHLTDEVIDHILNNDTLCRVNRLSIEIMKPCCKSIFQSLAVERPGKLWRETLQCSEEWKKARQLRISGSRVYGIYTYTKNKSPNWEQKSNKYFWPAQFTNKFIRHGLEYEQLARRTYENKLNVKVVQCGFIVHPEHRWIGYSPDGLIFRNNGPHKLIEIKCVYLGKSKPVKKCLSSCSFLDRDGNIKKKHTYYGQIQLGMLLCNVQTCDFIIFASFDKSIHVQSVPFDEKFAIEMVTVVQKAYVEQMLHYICLRQQEEDEQ